jgi:hypothetical protein
MSRKEAMVAVAAQTRTARRDVFDAVVAHKQQP